MAVTTTTTALYTKFKQKLGTGLIDLSVGPFEVLLTTSTYVPDLTTDEFASTPATNELSGNGYARATITPTWSVDGSVMRFIVTDPVFTASGGSLVARRWVLLMDDGVADTSSPLVATGLLDENDLDVTATDGNSITVDFANVNGLFSF
jgi:hypothetical protein